MFSATWTSSSSPVRHFLYGDIQCLLCKHGCPSWFGWIKFLFFQQYNRFPEAETQIKDVIIWNCEVRMRLFCLFRHTNGPLCCVFFFWRWEVLSDVSSLSLFAALWWLWAYSRPHGLHGRMQHRDVCQHRWEKPLSSLHILFCAHSKFALPRKYLLTPSQWECLKVPLCKPAVLLFSPGQTVELLERPSERPGWCLVRTTDRSPPQEGLVPSSTLCVSHSRSSVEMDCFFGSGKGRNSKPGSLGLEW